MRKILTLLATLTLSTVTTTNVIACGSDDETSMITKNNLNKIDKIEQVKKLNNNYSTALTEPYSKLDDIIVRTYFGNSLKNGYKIKYYRDENDENEINNNTNQIPGDVYFTISAADDDPLWYGTTPRLSVYLVKLNLTREVTQDMFTSSNFNKAANFNKPVVLDNDYTDLNEDIIKFIVFINNIKLSKIFYEIKYYRDEQGKNEITNNKQSPGDVYFTITAADDNPFWYGTTKILKVTLT